MKTDHRMFWQILFQTNSCKIPEKKKKNVKDTEPTKMSIGACVNWVKLAIRNKSFFTIFKTGNYFQPSM